MNSLLLVVTIAAAQQPAPRVEIVPLAPGVWAATRREPLALAGNGNSLIVEQDDGVIVFDAQFTREATLEHLAAVRRLTRKPVKWVINSHWHDDHFAGNQVYRDSFPGVQFVIHANTRADLETQGRPNRVNTRTAAPPLAARFRRLLDMGLGIDSTTVSAKERESFESALRIMNRYLAEQADFRETMDGPSVQQKLVLGRGANAVEVRWFGRGNTRGDLVAWLPSRRVVATGDLVVWPVPFAFNSWPAEWIGVLDSIAALNPRVLLPGHGPVQRDLAYLRQTRAMLAEVRDSAEAVAARRDSTAVALRNVKLNQYRQAVTGGEKWMTYMYDNFLVQPAVVSALQGARGRRGALSRGTTAITGVNVVPMTRDTVLRGATVLVVDGRIAAVGRDIAIPAGARRVDGRGKYLAPGLADMHTHLYADEALPDSVAPAELGVMLAAGITTARLMIGTPEHLTLRRQVRAGEVTGPQLWVASPQLANKQYHNGLVASTPDEGRAAVRTVADAGYDFVKLTMGISPETYEAIVDEAQRRRIRVVGHVEPATGVARALKAGQQIEHLDAYFEAVLADSAPVKASLTQGGVFDTTRWASLDHVDDAKIAAIAGATARANVWSSPTLNVFNVAFAAREEEEVIRGRRDFRLMPARTREGYLRARERYWSPANARHRTDARRARYVQVRNALVKAIHDSGGKIIAGSDTPEWFHAYGFGLHRELQAYVAAGLTPYQALATATRNPAEFLFQANEWGTVEPGKRADLILLDANPLEDIANTMKIDAVMVGGRLLPRAELERMLAAGERAMAAER